MNLAGPHYLLFSQSHEPIQPGHWRFVLRAADGSDRIVADDVDPDARGERLELLAVVRGLEALGQPSRVTLMTPSAYVREGIRYGLPEWRDNGWRWESFGQMVPVKNHDLWKRVDRALGFHQVECRIWRFDPPHPALPSSVRIRHHAAGEQVVLTNRREPRSDEAERSPQSDRRQIQERFGSRRIAGAWACWCLVLGLGRLVGLGRLCRPGRSETTEDPNGNGFPRVGSEMRAQGGARANDFGAGEDRTVPRRETRKSA